MVGRWHFLVCRSRVGIRFRGDRSSGADLPVGDQHLRCRTGRLRAAGIVDSSGNVHAVWTRSDGTNFRIQYATRTPTGAWSARSTSPTRARAPRSRGRVDPSGNMLAVWSRSDGTNLRIQATFKPAAGASAHRSRSPTRASTRRAPARLRQHGQGDCRVVAVRRHEAPRAGDTRTAGAGGTFAQRGDALRRRGRTRSTRSAPPVPNVDANGVVVLDPLRRLEPAGAVLPPPGRRRLTRGPRAPPLRVSLVPAYNDCAVAEPHARRTADPVLQPAGEESPRADGRLAGRERLRGELRSLGASGRSLTAMPRPRRTRPTSSAVSRSTTSATNPTVTDYTGPSGSAEPQDHGPPNSPEQPEPGTVQSSRSQFPVQCVSTLDHDRGPARIQLDQPERDPSRARCSRSEAHDLGDRPDIVRDAGPERHGLRRLPADLR